MANQIKRIKLLKLYSENTLFDPVEFKDGINIVLGEKYDSTTTWMGYTLLDTNYVDKWTN